MPLYTLAVQNATEPSLMGQAIPASQFFRQIEGALAASALGAVLSFTLAHSLPAAAQAPSASRPAVVAEGPAVPAGAAAPVVRAAFATAIRRMYIVDILLIVPSLLLTLLMSELPLRNANEAVPVAGTAASDG